MHNHYKTLGLTNAASPAEIRRAYRILARRYHPDVNPDGHGEELFKQIALAYSVLNDPEQKKQHDLELKQRAESFAETFERANEALKRHQRAAAYARQQQHQQQPPPKPEPTIIKRKKPVPVKRAKTRSQRPTAQTPALDTLAKAPKLALDGIRKVVAKVRRKEASQTVPTVGQLALIELSVSMLDAIQGTRRTVEIQNADNTPRKVSVFVPPGARTGSIIRLRNKERPEEEVVLIVRVETHPWLSLTDRGLTMEIPLTVAEAIEGCKIPVPSLGDPLLVTVEPLTQSGKEVRLKNQGIADREGVRGDLYIRFVVKIPDKPLPDEIKSLTELLSEAYSTSVRNHLPTRIGEG